MKYMLFLPLLFFVWLPCFSQNISSQNKLYGRVKDVNNEPLNAANILLLRLQDSGLVKGKISDNAGLFSFENIPAGKYRLSLSLINYEQIFSPAFDIADNQPEINAGSFVLKKLTKELSAVTVVSKKPLFEQKIDRMVVNVRNSITSAGGTALEVLEKSPGIVINRQTNALSMAAKSGVVIMINGKISHMPSSAIIQMLEGMAASNIERIELITTPPANFDAEGNAGFINIVLIANPNTGLNGSFALSAGYGKGEVGAGNINFNYRKNKLNFYGDYSYARDSREQIFYNYRKIDYLGIITENYATTLRSPLQQNHNARLGIDYQVTPKTVIGALIGGYDSRWTMNARNTITMYKDKVADTSLIIKNNELNHWKNFVANLNMQHNFKPDHTLSLDFDYLYYSDDNPNDYLNSYYNGAGNFLLNEQTRSGKLTPINTWVGKVDYTAKLSKKINFEAGIKGTLSRFTNDVDVARYKQTNWVSDSSLSGQYLLKENIEALYSSADIALNDKTSLKLGLRYEYTNSNLGTTITKNIVDRHYGKLFPSFFISHKINDSNAVNLSYSKRISRPSFNDLAPFTIFLDPSTFFTGNAALQPSFSDEVKVDYTYKKYILSLAYSIENNSIAEFQPKVDITTNKQYVTAENLENLKTISASLSLPFDITKWWTMQNNFIGAWQQVNAFYNAAPFRLQHLILNFNSSQSFKLPKDYSMEISGFFDAGGIYGTSRYKALGALNFGLQKKLNGNYGKLRFSVNDILKSISYKTYVDIPGQHFYTRSDYNFSQRTFKLTWSKNFGNNSLKGKRERNTASEEERQRVKN
ncbi:MAG: TonB dependent receptor [Ferruginibacter sp.]